MTNETKTTTKHIAIAEELRRGILLGSMKPHDRLPSFAEMKERFGIAKQTSERVFSILERDGLIHRQQGKGIYVAPAAGRKKTGYVGYIDLWPWYSNRSTYFLELQSGMRHAAGKKGKSVILIDSPQEFAGWGDLEGVLICQMGYLGGKDLRPVLPAELPVINLIFDDPVFPSVKADDAAGMRLVTEHLLKLGHRRIGYLAHINHSLIHERYQAFRETLLRGGVEPLAQDKIIPPPELQGNYPRTGYEAMKKYFQHEVKDQAFTAVLTQNDQVAYGALRALEEMGIRVPQDMSIVGFDGVQNTILDGTSDNYWSEMALTTVKVPLFDIAAAALDALLSEEYSSLQAGYPIVLPVELLEGESCCVPPKNSPTASVIGG